MKKLEGIFDCEFALMQQKINANSTFKKYFIFILSGSVNFLIFRKTERTYHNKYNKN